MVAHADIFEGVQFGKFDTYEELSQSMNKHIKVDNQDIIFFCVGTDRSTGDSLAPWIGTMLIEQGYENVMGTIDDPVHAVNLDEKIKLIPEGKTVIAIDAALGRMQHVGKFAFNSGALHAGKGVGKSLTPIGDYHINGIVNVSGDLNYLILQSTRLSVVMRTAKEITSAINRSFPMVSVKGMNLTVAK